MRCTSPKTVSFTTDGRLTFTPKTFSRELVPFQKPCENCIECRLEYARQLAVRCVHEAEIHEKNTFITCTYSDQNLTSPILQYRDFQLFIKRLRNETNDPFGYVVTGEYGEINKRPHWHALLFNYQFPDLEYLRTSELGDKLYKSNLLEKLWGKNDPKRKPNEIGDVTFHSAGYVARYSAKKLVHDFDFNDNFKPIHKRSSKHAIGKKYLEKHWESMLQLGNIMILNKDGSHQTCAFPRYYTKWMKENHPEEYKQYVTQNRQAAIDKAEKKSAAEAADWSRRLVERDHENYQRAQAGIPVYGTTLRPITRLETRRKLSLLRFARLQNFNKL